MTGNDESQDESLDKLQQEVDANYRAFVATLDQYMPRYNEKFALMHNGKVEQFFDTWQDAYNAGNLIHKDALFSVQKVTRQPADLGYFSRV